MTDSDYLFALRLQDELDAFNEEHVSIFFQIEYIKNLNLFDLFVEARRC